MICYAFQICPPWLLTCTSALPPLGWGAADLHYPPPPTPHPQRQVSPAEVCQSYTPSNTAVTLTYTPHPWLVLSPKVGQSYIPLLAFYQTYNPPSSPKLLCWLTPPPLLWLVPSPKVGRSYTPLLFIRLTQHPELLFWLTLLPLGWFLQKKVSHTLPVLHHVVNLPQTVHQVRTMLV